MKRIDLYLQSERLLTEEELLRCQSALERRAMGEPVAYIIGHVEFADTTIYVDPSVLIPRPETELFVQRLAAFVEGDVWDVCTGSGAIGIALKKAFPQLCLTLSDCASLVLARKNAAHNKVDVTFLQGDLLEPFDGMCDVLVSNPPYIIDYEKLDREVREFEPRLALEGGYHFYERLAQEKKRVRKWICLEVGAGMGASVVEIFGGGWIERDWAGHDRFFFWNATFS